MADTEKKETGPLAWLKNSIGGKRVADQADKVVGAQDKAPPPAQPSESDELPKEERDRIQAQREWRAKQGRSYSSGGAVRSRDGIAQRGKTRA